MLKTKRKKKTYRPGIFIEAGVHGREWITPAVATWIIKELVKHNNTQGHFHQTHFIWYRENFSEYLCHFRK